MIFQFNDQLADEDGGGQMVQVRITKSNSDPRCFCFGKN